MEIAVQDPQNIMLGFAEKVEANLDAANCVCVLLIAALSLFGFISLKAGAGWIGGLIIGCAIFFIAIATAVLLGRRVLCYSWRETRRVTGLGMMISALCLLVLCLFF